MADASQLPGVVKSYHLLNQYRKQSKKDIANKLSQPTFLGQDIINAAKNYSYLAPFQGNLKFALNNYGLGTPTNIADDLQGAWGDPHFNFVDSTGEKVTIDHKGTDGQTYNILNADGLDIDAEYKIAADPNNPQVMGAVRIQAGLQQLILNEGKVILDGKELKAGTKKLLGDSRIIEVQENGNLKINTKDGIGNINIVNQGDYYDIDPSGQLNIDTTKDSGGVLGFLTVLGQHKSKEEILNQYDTNKDGKLDDKDEGLAQSFSEVNDIGLYQYDKSETKDLDNPAIQDKLEKAKQWAMSAEDNAANIYSFNPNYEFNL